MSFGWSAWSPVNLCIDLAFLGSFAFLARRAQTLGDLRRAALLTAIPWFLGASAEGGLGFFLLARLLWTGLTVAVPLVALRLFWLRRQPRLLLFLLLPFSLKVYGEVWEPNRLDVERVRIALKGLNGVLRIVHVSDLQTDGLRQMHMDARDAANAFDPDFVVFTGDVANHASLIPGVEEYLRGYRHRRGAFFVSGDVDGILPLADFCARSGFECLGDRARLLDVASSRLAFLGLAVGHERNPALMARLVSETAGADARIVLSHRPDVMWIARSFPVQLVMAGHTHGGQVCLPWFGPLVTFSSVPRRFAAGGLHQIENLFVLVSRGLGMEGHLAPRVRTFDRPHLVLVELEPG